MESALSLFKQLPETKSEIKNYTRIIKEKVLDGEVNVLEFAARVSALEQLFKALKSDHLIKDVILEESEKYGSKSFEQGNAKFQIKEVGVKFDFTTCMDVEWESLDSELKRISELKKEREAFLKTIKPGMEIFGSDGVQLMPPVKTSTTQVVILLK